ncbi:PX domain-containing protein [Arthroderma uncinatum]|uniref:PX domain-containing protein n=1 Tax=Arthroderma uncinatum TaxID=74035 RepID=UPI00144AB852|nr:PX domain-containing protein [Arthroderma uncinatum]KAF3481913.1 PX domain-containing protein [Arthroderma uncinatum]
MGNNAEESVNGEKGTERNGTSSSQILSGKQEHFSGEIAELNSPTALRRFGAPFKSDFGEIAPVDSELPILRYIFVNHVRNFPFLDKAHEKEFWQDRLQVDDFGETNIEISPTCASSKAMKQFLTDKPITLNEEEQIDIARRKELDAKRIEEQKRFYEIARKRARELDVYMEQFRRDIVESNGLTKLFQEIKEKDSVEALSPKYQKFAEWLRIEVAATLYHVFLAEDNSPELFAQAKRIHSLIPYTILKNVIRIANPAAVMAGVLDLFLAQPFGARSLLQRIFSMAIQDGMKAFQKSVDSLATKIEDDILVDKLRAFTEADESVKNDLRAEAEAESVDIVVVILRSEHFEPELTVRQIEKVFNSYVAWVSAVESIHDPEIQQGAQWFSYLKQLLKVLTRQRDKAMMLNIIEEPVTLQLFRDLFTIFYEPLVRVYKSANVYNSITDFAEFANDAIAVIERAQRQDVSADPNQTVQSFIDLCTRHQQSFYKFVHEVHLHDNGLFASLMSWLEDILKFLREGPESGGKLDMNALFQGAVSASQIDKTLAIQEIDAVIKWHSDRKKWHQDKTRQKMAAEGVSDPMPGVTTFKSSDFGLDEADLEDLAIEDDASDPSDEDSEDDEMDPIAFERKRRAKHQDRLRRTAECRCKVEASLLLIDVRLGLGGSLNPTSPPTEATNATAILLEKQIILRRRTAARITGDGGCGFFLWDDDAKQREAAQKPTAEEEDCYEAFESDLVHAVDERVKQSPILRTPQANRIRDSIFRGGLLTPESQPKRRRDGDITDYLDPDESPSKRGRLNISASQTTRRDITPLFTENQDVSYPSLASRLDVLDAIPPPPLFSTPNKRTQSLGSVTRTTRETLPDLPSTPTPSRVASSPFCLPASEGNNKRSRQSELKTQIFDLLESHKVHLPLKTKQDLAGLLDMNDLRTLGIIKGRDISRLAIKEREKRIEGLLSRIEVLEAERESWRALSLNIYSTLPNGSVVGSADNGRGEEPLESAEYI